MNLKVTQISNHAIAEESIHNSTEVESTFRRLSSDQLYQAEQSEVCLQKQRVHARAAEKKLILGAKVY